MGEMFQNPAFFLDEKIVNSGFWHCVRCADSYLSGSADLNRQCPAIAADNKVGKGMWIHEKSSLYMVIESMRENLYLQINKKDSR